MKERDAFTLDRALVRRSFERAAPGYDEAAVLQREVGARLLERTELTTLAPRRILDLGCGSGRPTRELRWRYAKAEVLGLDLALPMLRLARRRQPWFRPARFVCAEASALPFASSSFDLLYANLVLQWCEDLDAVFLEWRRVLKSPGLLLFSSFGPDTLKELRSAWGEADGLNHVNRFLDMHDVGDALIRAGFVEPVMDVERVTLTYEDVFGLMRDLKGIGAHNVTAGRGRGLTGRGRLAAMTAAYERYRRDGRLPATYEVVYGTAWAPKFMPTAALQRAGTDATKGGTP
jgi:malonyl-CoA O-methyltransferase